MPGQKQSDKSKLQVYGNKCKWQPKRRSMFAGHLRLDLSFLNSSIDSSFPQIIMQRQAPKNHALDQQEYTWVLENGIPKVHPKTRPNTGNNHTAKNYKNNLIKMDDVSNSKTMDIFYIQKRLNIAGTPGQVPHQERKRTAPFFTFIEPSRLFDSGGSVDEDEKIISSESSRRKPHSQVRRKASKSPTKVRFATTPSSADHQMKIPVNDERDPTNVIIVPGANADATSRVPLTKTLKQQLSQSFGIELEEEIKLSPITETVTPMPTPAGGVDCGQLDVKAEWENLNQSDDGLLT